MRHIKRYKQLFESSQELTQEQRDWIDSCTEGPWRVNPQTGLVDVDLGFDCTDQNLTDFKGVRFGEVGGDFYCFDNRLTSLEGAPLGVGSSFYCNRNMLASLEGAPQKVGWNFDCSNNELTSLEGAPQRVVGAFSCSHNRLTSLEGAPQSVGGYYKCSHNSLKSLEGAPESVDASFNCSHNSLTSLEGAPQSVGGYFNCSYNELTSLDGAPQKVYGYCNCSNNSISEEAINGVLRSMSDKKIPLEQAVAEYWRNVYQGDRIYLAKHNPNFSPEEKGEYAALERLKRRVI